MKLTAITRYMLHHRKAVRALTRDGFEEVDEGGGRLWELHRGWRCDHTITDVRIGPTGKTIFIKTTAHNARVTAQEQATNAPPS